MQKRYRWAAPGDVNAFFGLMLDNIADLLLTVSLLAMVFEFPTEFALRHMVPGTAIGVLVGDLIFFWMALRLAKRTGNDKVTAMPLGLDTPSTFGMVFFVLGPAFVSQKFHLIGTGMAEEQAILTAARYTWHIGICCIVLSGVFKFACAFCSNWVRRVVPRAGLLGSLSAIALVLIAFLPLLEVFHYPVVGFISLAIILTTLVAHIRLPGKVPGALGAMLVAGLVYYLMQATGAFLIAEPDSEPFSLIAYIQSQAGFHPRDALLPYEWLAVFKFEWLGAMDDAAKYLPIVIPFALATVVGGIDCTESAAAAGDEFDTNQIIGVEAFATLIAGLCGGVIQSTPYIGHPAYKAMGGRAAYTLATALFVGGAGLIGYFGLLYAFIPKATVFPILIFIGLEITAQSFQVTPKRHYAAIAIACLPAMAALCLIFYNQLQGQYMEQVAELNNAIRRIDEDEGLVRLDENFEEIKARGETLEKMAGYVKDDKFYVGEPLGPLGKNMQTVRMLASGFIISSLLWASAVAAIVDGRLYSAARYFAVGGLCALFGIIHSPFHGSPLVLPGALPENLPVAAEGQTPIYMASAYVAAALLLAAWGWWIRQTNQGAIETADKSTNE